MIVIRCEGLPLFPRLPPPVPQDQPNKTYLAHQSHVKNNQTSAKLKRIQKLSRGDLKKSSLQKLIFGLVKSIKLLKGKEALFYVGLGLGLDS